LEVWAGDRQLPLGGALQQRILTALLLETGRAVPVTRLIEAAWGEKPPATARHQVRKAVAELRVRIPGGASMILTEGSGYRARVATEQLDLSMFAHWAQRAKAARAEGDLERAAECLRSALGLWRGPLANDGHGRVLSAAAAGLEEDRLAIVEELFDVRLALGESRQVIGDLRALAEAHPLRESIQAQLMLALYRSGRQAEALAEYSRIRTLLADELGIDPGPELSGLHQRILRASPELSTPEACAEESNPPTPPWLHGPSKAPCTLPYDLPDFSGRARELQELLESARREVGSRIVAVDGMGGSGKTALAVHAAHQLAGEYPDGRLYIDLRSFTPGEKPLPPEAVVAVLLRSLGVPGTLIPDDAHARFVLWKKTMETQRLIVLLDNAADASQIRPLLPASSRGLIVITSRSRMLDIDGAHWISLGTLEPEDSRVLLARTLGEERMAAEPEATEALAEMCGHLPLALRIATARLRNRPRWTIRYFVSRLQGESRLLEELRSSERSVAMTIRLSYQALNEDQARAFRFLGLHPGADIDVYTAAAVLLVTPDEAEEILERLLDMHLLRQQEVGLYSFHDLVRSFALSLWNIPMSHEGRTVLEQLLDYCVAATDAACRRLFPGRPQYEGLPCGAAKALPPLENQIDARRWFDQEIRTLEAVVKLGHEYHFDKKAAYLARNVAYHLHSTGAIREYRQVGEVAVAAARRTGDPLLLRLSLSNLASAHQMLGDFRASADAAAEALRIARSHGEPVGEAVCHDLLGWVHSALGHLSKGRRYLQQGITLHRKAGEAVQEAMALCNLSSVCSWQGCSAEAIAAAERAVALCAGVGRHEHELAALNDLVAAHLDAGELAPALRHLDRALELSERTAMPRNRAVTLVLLADVRQRVGDDGEVPTYLERALELIRPLGTAAWQCEIENQAGLVHLRRAEYARAQNLFRDAHRRGLRVEFRIGVARALAGLALAAEALGDDTTARKCSEEANELFDAMDVPERCRSRL
jgi:DNA-binding SARP family transcriptional activator